MIRYLDYGPSGHSIPTCRTLILECFVFPKNLLIKPPFDNYNKCVLITRGGDFLTPTPQSADLKLQDFAIRVIYSNWHVIPQLTLIDYLIIYRMDQEKCAFVTFLSNLIGTNHRTNINLFNYGFMQMQRYFCQSSHKRLYNFNGDDLP